jgi:hypothetical protein
MDFLQSLQQGFAALASVPIVLALLAGAAIGIVVGVLPGVGPGVTIAVLLPFTYGMAPLAGISLLLGVYVRRLLRRRGHLHPDPHAGRSLVDHDHVRRLPDGAAAARPQRALSLAFMLGVHRWHRERAVAGRWWRNRWRP